MNKSKTLALSTFSFEKIIKDNNIYVDKTKYVYDILTTSGYFFLSRPRRYGKSLLLSTIEKIFEGKKELFKDTFIYNSDWQWPVHPVIAIDWSTIKHDTLDGINLGINDFFNNQSEIHNIELSTKHTIEMKLQSLIQQLAARGKAPVILIDEYDKAILDNILNPELADQMREILRSFYSILKGSDKDLKLVFLTGVSRFSKVSIFSGLNNLNDLTYDARFNAVCGYTQQEIIDNYTPFVEQMAAQHNLTFDQTVEKLREKYDGYCFSKYSTNEPRLFNPFSVVRSLNSAQFDNHWLESGTPTFLMDLIRERDFPVQDFVNTKIIEDELGAFNVINLPLTTLLFQTGYLTIKSVNLDNMVMTLNFSNAETAQGFNSYLLRELTQSHSFKLREYGPLMQKALNQNNITEFCEQFSQLLKVIPYTVVQKMKAEIFFAHAFVFVCKFLGMDVLVELPTLDGRIDAVLKTKTRVYIFEFKTKKGTMQKTLESALKQLEGKKYHEFFANQPLPIILIGLVVNPKKAELLWQEKEI